jgi:RNA polymerase sigma-54 factor
MAITPRLDLRQTQSLIMTPQLQQAIKLLQMSSLELGTFVETEMEQNPLLLRDEADTGAEFQGGEEPAAEPADVDPEVRDSAELAASDTMPAAADEPLDVDYENVWTSDDTGIAGDDVGDFGGRLSSGRGSEVGDQAGNLEQTVSGRTTLRDHLMEQLGVDVADPVDRLIGLHLIDMLDESGWLSGDLDQVAETLNCDRERVLGTLERLQCFDPPGIFARSLSECLALQLRDRDRLDPAMQALLDNLDLLAKRDVVRLMRACGVDAADLADMVAEIRSLNPKPASAFDHEVAQPVTPDVIVRPLPEGDWLVEVNSETLPRVLVDRRYYAEVSRVARQKADRDYILERLHSANWLVKSLHQRVNTILKVAKEIVRQQEAFFLHGVRYLKPLVLRDIAAVIEMHESTVSRATSNKFMATPRGIYEFKYFFTSAIPAAGGGDAHSAESVRFRIKALIDTETLDKVLSDDRIVELLRSDGVDIARRTVAKYREGMGIASSVQRRREKSISL